jgi:hypothetical protein
MVAAVIQEAFHAWFDLVASDWKWGFVMASEEEGLSSYRHHLLENWLSIRDQLKCGAINKQESKTLWEGTKAAAQGYSTPKLIARLKGHMGDFETVNPY